MQFPNNAIEIWLRMKQIQNTEAEPLETSRNSTTKLVSKY